jgi:hypothetical protein
MLPLFDTNHLSPPQHILPKPHLAMASRKPGRSLVQRAEHQARHSNACSRSSDPNHCPLLPDAIRAKIMAFGMPEESAPGP